MCDAGCGARGRFSASFRLLRHSRAHCTHTHAHTHGPSLPLTHTLEPRTMLINISCMLLSSVDQVKRIKLITRRINSICCPPAAARHAPLAAVLSHAGRVNKSVNLIRLMLFIGRVIMKKEARRRTRRATGRQKASGNAERQAERQRRENAERT